MNALKIIPQGDEGLYYWVNIVCGNCGFKNYLAFLKGISVDEHECPNCELDTLSRLG